MGRLGLSGGVRGARQRTRHVCVALGMEGAWLARRAIMRMARQVQSMRMARQVQSMRMAHQVGQGAEQAWSRRSPPTRSPPTPYRQGPRSPPYAVQGLARILRVRFWWPRAVLRLPLLLRLCAHWLVRAPPAGWPGRKAQQSLAQIFWSRSPDVLILSRLQPRTGHSQSHHLWRAHDSYQQLVCSVFRVVGVYTLALLAEGRGRGGRRGDRLTSKLYSPGSRMGVRKNARGV